GTAVQHRVRKHSQQHPEQSALNKDLLIGFGRKQLRITSCVLLRPDSVCSAVVFISSVFIAYPAVIRLRLYQHQDVLSMLQAQANKMKLL
ncbi:hypothetical protein MZO44_17145, partial [Lactiplantibacillus sp. E932]|uniref:hypothetical protein n=1 Tax=Lactiplantibacillus plantarum TaxID=1590 RepID=UPI00207712BA